MIATDTEATVAIIQEVDAANAGRVFTTGRKVWLTFVALSFLVMMFAGTAIAAEGGLNLIGDHMLIALSPSAAVLALVAGMVLFIVGAIVCLYAQHAFFLMTYDRLIRRAIAERIDPLVSPTDPDAWFVKWTPRNQWHEVMLDDAADVGLLKIDRRSDLLVFEGDHVRHIVPLERIAHCATEFAGSGWEPFTVVVVQVEASEPTELCYEYNQLRGPLSRATGARRAEALVAHIHDAMGTA